MVLGVGAGGSLTGVARVLGERTDVHVVAVEPARSAVMSGGAAGPHGTPGIGAGHVAGITDLSLVDEIVAVRDEDAAATAHEIAATTGVLVGVSWGSAAHAARLVAGRARGGARRGRPS
ncbi:pyridoxal-phosphate dependent enzyme [Streptomyces sp. NPDC019507]|uniref:pyridoxal-phosphate dependent enzyme n=1 Tax=Streptomyces sp. NPDC019507 TaxID=3154689 RepID=UPI00340D316E